MLSVNYTVVLQAKCGVKYNLETVNYMKEMGVEIHAERTKWYRVSSM